MHLQTSSPDIIIFQLRTAA